MSGTKLFPSDVKSRKWASFKASGYSKNVAGVVYQSGEAVCGLPLGGIATGAIDLNTDGTLGRCTCFNSIIPPRDLNNMPFLGLAVDGEVWALTTKEISGIQNAEQIRYWGHYPVADIQYELKSPIDVSLRAWSPFIPGNAQISNTPGAIFEVHVTNTTKAEKRVTLAFTFPGLSTDEVKKQKVVRSRLTQNGFGGMQVKVGQNAGYVLAVEGKKVSVGGDLGNDPGAWKQLSKTLPSSESSASGVSVATELNLKGGQTEVIRFLLTWYFPILDSGPHAYVHAYGPRFDDAPAVATYLAKEHKRLLSKIIAWQEVIYAETSLPDWLRDCLINSLYLLAEDSFWASNSLPPDDWAKETGMFTMVESTRTCPGQSCIPSDFYGNFPVVYFFPTLAKSTLRGFANLQRPNGEIPIYWGQNYERHNPVYQLLHVTSPCNYVDLVDRLWQRTGDDTVAYEFYPSVKRAVQYLQSLDKDADGLLDCDPGKNCAHQFYNSWYWQGPAVHVVGMWLSVLQMAQRMAQKVQDFSFAKDCQVWLNLGQRSLEEKLWNGKYYLLYNDTTSKAKSDTILSNQLCGQWCTRLHGTADAFPSQRVKTVFDTVKKKCIPAAKCGAAGAIRPDGTIDSVGGETSEGTFTPESLILAMTMIYCGEKATGLKIAYETMHNLVLELGLQWDLPNTIDTKTGKLLHGNDFDQMMIVWALPLALANSDISQACAGGSLIQRILDAGRIE